MSMSKKDFIALADMMKQTRPMVPFYLGGLEARVRYGGALHQWGDMRAALADFCAAQNPRFNRERWLAYIAGQVGPNGGKVKGGKGGAK